MSADVRAAFLHACELDVAVRKPGNVSDLSPGHGMDAALFRASARAAADALCRPGSRVGARIEAAVAASWAAAGCNTNLGIVLLCAPLAAAAERVAPHRGIRGLRAALDQVLGELDLADAAAAYRAIAMAHPGGLGSAAEQDVHRPPTIDLRAAMALAADRDLVARQYRDAYADLLRPGLLSLAETALAAGKPEAASAVQRLYLRLLATLPDSHIVRKRGAGVAQTVMQRAQAWLARLEALSSEGLELDRDPAWVAWDDGMKASGVNPGTTADLTVATLMAAGLLKPRPALQRGPARSAHGG